MSDDAVLVAAKDGKPGCPEPIWYDGCYGPHRCGFGVLGTCHQHGKFAVVPAAEYAPSGDVEPESGTPDPLDAAGHGGDRRSPEFQRNNMTLSPTQQSRSPASRATPTRLKAAGPNSTPTEPGGPEQCGECGEDIQPGDDVFVRASGAVLHPECATEEPAEETR